MLSKIRRRVEKLIHGPVLYDPTLFSDVRAHKIGWLPISYFARPFALKIMSPELAIFRRSYTSYFRAVLFVSFIAAIATSLWFGHEKGNLGLRLAFIFHATLFVLVGVLLLLGGTNRAKFDLNKNAFFPAGPAGELISLNQLLAIQVLAFSSEDGDGGFGHRYELNIVLHDHRRFNLCAHMNLSRIKGDARELQAFLKNRLPIWDGTDPK